MKDYIRFIREKVGHQCIFLNFVGAVVKNKKMKFYSKIEEMKEDGDF